MGCVGGGGASSISEADRWAKRAAGFPIARTAMPVAATADITMPALRTRDLVTAPSGALSASCGACSARNRGTAWTGSKLSVVGIGQWLLNGVVESLAFYRGPNAEES